MEVWQPVLRGEFEVSDRGRVRRPGGSPLVLKTSGEYPELTTSLRGRKVTLRVHTLIATAFLGPRPRGRQVNHRNGRKHDNRSSNIEWATASQNIRHAVALGTFPVGERNGRSRLNRAQVRSIRAQADRGVSVRCLGERYGVSWSQAARVARREAWSWLA